MEQKSSGKPHGGKTKILLADDHPVVVEGLVRALEKEPDFEVVGTAPDGLQAVKLEMSSVAQLTKLAVKKGLIKC